MHGEMHTDYGERFPTFALETTFVATYALLEDELMSICGLVQRHLKLELGRHPVISSSYRFPYHEPCPG
jgi:hypothetical protein